jgi:hypothetical protein
MYLQSLLPAGAFLGSSAGGGGSMTEPINQPAASINAQNAQTANTQPQAAHVFTVNSTVKLADNTVIGVASNSGNATVHGQSSTIH